MHVAGREEQWPLRYHTPKSGVNVVYAFCINLYNPTDSNNTYATHTTTRLSHVFILKS